MKQVLIAITLLVAFIAGPAYAACDLSNVGDLPQAKVKELELLCQQALDETEKVVVPGLDIQNPEALSAYGQVAQEWARALGIAARELGIAVDEFLGTTAGKMTAALIIWQVAGEEIAGILIGVPLLIAIMLIGWKLGKGAMISKITYSETKTNWRGKPVVTEIDYIDLDKEGSSLLVIGLVTIVLSIWVVAGIIT